jgi:homogentisate 1,2-dioxygenase
MNSKKNLSHFHLTFFYLAGVAALDFVVFPPRFAVTEDTFRPPYYHRNIMTEFMGNIMGTYDAKAEGFVPGSASLHSCMMGHGPDSGTYDRFSDKNRAPTGPVRMSKNDLAFMFETTYMLKLTPWANDADRLQTEYYKCWMGLKNEFKAE